MTTGARASHWPRGPRFVLLSTAIVGAILMGPGCPTESDDDAVGDDDVADDDTGDDDTSWVQVDVEYHLSCGLRANGKVECWGCGYPYDFGQCDPPPGYAFLQIDAKTISYGITTDHELVCWPPHEECNPYERRFLQISVGGESLHACGLTTDHEILCWGCDPDLNQGECDPPAGR